MYLSGEHDGDDEPVDGDCLAENDRDQVLGFNSWGLHTSTNDAEKDTNINIQVNSNQNLMLLESHLVPVV